jgi:predicted outer membrane repeat protein
MTRTLHRRLRLEALEDRTTPATFSVTTTLDVVNGTDGVRSLREAITAANNLAGADTIVLSAGVFKLAIAGVGDNVNSSGDLDIIDAVTIRGAAAGATFIDGQQLDRVFDVIGNAPSSIKVVFAGLTVRNGNATGHGGGIQVGNADLVVRDAVVSGNSAFLTGGGISNGTNPGTGNVKLVRTTVARNLAREGGGVCVTGLGSTVTLTDSTVRRNFAGDGSGGGIRAWTATLTDSTVSDNFTNSYGGGIDINTATLTNSTVRDNFAISAGGGIYTGTATLTGCTVSGNIGQGSTGGGGIFALNVTLSGCTVSGNTTHGLGGGGINAFTSLTLNNSTVSGNSSAGFTGVDSGGGGISTPTATLTNSTVSGNYSAGSGGGIRATTATLTNCTVSGNVALSGSGVFTSTANLTNCTISGNSAIIDGGGIYISTGATFLNCTIVENIADNGGGIFRAPAATQAVLVRNTLIALNIGVGPDVNGTFVSQGNNLIGIGDGGAGFTNGSNGDLVGTSIDPIDPKIGALALNGGRTKTHALLAGSPAIDKGNNAGAPATDQRGAGFPRKKDGDGNGSAIADIGAFEK